MIQIMSLNITMLKKMLTTKTLNTKSFEYSNGFCILELLHLLFLSKLKSSVCFAKSSRSIEELRQIGRRKKFFLPSQFNQGEKVNSLFKKYFGYCLYSIIYFICTFLHKIIYIINMVIINKQLNSTNKNYRRGKKLLRKNKLP